MNVTAVDKIVDDIPPKTAEKVTLLKVINKVITQGKVSYCFFRFFDLRNVNQHVKYRHVKL